jgi:hypothetical protein
MFDIVELDSPIDGIIVGVCPRAVKARPVS